jgi:hypothetical protein
MGRDNYPRHPWLINKLLDGISYFNFNALAKPFRDSEKKTELLQRNQLELRSVCAESRNNNNIEILQ